MKQEEFELEYFRAKETVIVNANELQALIRDKKALTRERDSLRHDVEKLVNSITSTPKQLYIDLKV